MNAMNNGNFPLELSNLIGRHSKIQDILQNSEKEINNKPSSQPPMRRRRVKTISENVKEEWGNDIRNKRRKSQSKNNTINMKKYYDTINPPERKNILFK